MKSLILASRQPRPLFTLMGLICNRITDKSLQPGEGEHYTILTVFGRDLRNLDQNDREAFAKHLREKLALIREKGDLPLLSKAARRLRIQYSKRFNFSLEDLGLVPEDLKHALRPPTKAPANGQNELEQPEEESILVHPCHEEVPKLSMSTADIENARAVLAFVEFGKEEVRKRAAEVSQNQVNMFTTIANALEVVSNRLIHVEQVVEEIRKAVKSRRI